MTITSGYLLFAFFGETSDSSMTYTGYRIRRINELTSMISRCTFIVIGCFETEQLARNAADIVDDQRRSIGPIISYEQFNQIISWMKDNGHL